MVATKRRKEYSLIGFPGAEQETPTDPDTPGDPKHCARNGKQIKNGQISAAKCPWHYGKRWQAISPCGSMNAHNRNFNENVVSPGRSGQESTPNQKCKILQELQASKAQSGRHCMSATGSLGICQANAGGIGSAHAPGVD